MKNEKQIENLNLSFEGEKLTAAAIYSPKLVFVYTKRTRALATSVNKYGLIAAKWRSDTNAM